MLTAVLFGWAPALHAMNADVRGAMSAATAGSTAPVRGRRTLWALVVAEFALASLMFVCGGLLVRAYDRVRNTDPGFDGSHVLTFAVNIPGATYSDSPKRIAFWNRLQERLRALPGVDEGGHRLLRPGQRLPLGMAVLQPRGRRHARPNDPNPIVLNRAASPEYFQAMGIRLKEGRLLHRCRCRRRLRQGRARSSSTRPSSRRSGRTAVRRLASGSATARKHRGAPWSASSTTSSTTVSNSRRGRCLHPGSGAVGDDGGAADRG